MAEARLLLAELDALRGELGRPHGRGAKRRGEARCGAVWAAAQQLSGEASSQSPRRRAVREQEGQSGP